MSIQELEAIRIREIIWSNLHDRLGDRYDITVGRAKIRDRTSFEVIFQVKPPRLTPMEERYLAMCDRYPKLKKSWLNSEIQLDDRTVILIGADDNGIAYNIILRDKLSGGNGYGGIHVNIKQLCKLMGDK